MEEKHEIRFGEWLKEKREIANLRGGRTETINTFSLVLSMWEAIQEFEKKGKQ